MAVVAAGRGGGANEVWASTSGFTSLDSEDTACESVEDDSVSMRAVRDDDATAQRYQKDVQGGSENGCDASWSVKGKEDR